MLWSKVITEPFEKIFDETQKASGAIPYFWEGLLGFEGPYFGYIWLEPVFQRHDLGKMGSDAWSLFLSFFIW